jgi:hypothetical protein
MIGIATMARSYVDALPEGSTTRITDIRKTTPGLRILERYAVRVGGAHNHRDNLGSAVLIKDNHIAACGGVGTAIGRARARAPHTSRIECEVDSLEQLDEALAAGADIVLLDNMDDDTVREAVRREGVRHHRGLRRNHPRAHSVAGPARGRRHLRRSAHPLREERGRRARLRLIRGGPLQPFARRGGVGSSRALVRERRGVRDGEVGYAPATHRSAATKSRASP